MQLIVMLQNVREPTCFICIEVTVQLQVFITATFHLKYRQLAWRHLTASLVDVSLRRFTILEGHDLQNLFVTKKLSSRNQHSIHDSFHE